MLSSKTKFIIRFIIVSAYALVILLMSKLLTGYEPAPGKLSPEVLVITYIFCFNFASEGNLLFDKYLNKKLPWFFHSWKRLVVQLIFTFLWTFIATAIPFTVWHHIYDVYFIFKPFPIFTYVSGVIFLIGFNGIYVASNFFHNWKASILEIENLKQEKLKSDYKVLQDQLNPHFLFNSFNVLISEIKHEPETAINFTRKLSQVYRYVLQARNTETISLIEEMDFTKSYIYLHQVRLGNAIKFSADLNEDILNKYLPPLTVQILVENAIRHNVVNSDSPLYIKIESTDEKTLTVKNNINPKKTIGSTQVGLSNIKERYSLLGKGEVIIEEKENEFIVTVPLLTD